MQPADPRLLREVGDLVYASLIQVLNFYARRDVYDGLRLHTTRVVAKLWRSHPILSVTIHYKSKEM
ncbi:hypothetical protein ACWATR_20445 [Nostoc sp. UIC 10890]